MIMRGFRTGRSGAFSRIAISAVLLLSLAGAVFGQTELGDPITFNSAGDSGRISVRSMAAGGTAVFLRTGAGERVISPPGGENLFPKVQAGADGYYILWVRYQARETFLGLYDSRTGNSGRIFPMRGLSFLGSPVVVERPPFSAGIAFIGNASNNDDVFYYDLTSGRLMNLTRTPASEKKFSIEPSSSGLRISVETLRDKTLMFLDFRTLSVKILGRGPVKPSGTSAARTRAAADEEEASRIANTYLAFGDSITWGKMRMDGLEGEYHPELAYPAKMVDALRTIYGPAYPVNLGVPGETTFDGARRIEADLSANPGAYFLLMMGTNDVTHGAFSVDSIMENIDFIVAAAESADLRAIISTIPPRKDALGLNPEVHQKMLDLNARIAEFAEAKPIGFIDTFGTFMAHDFPDGWRALLEDSGGNHPSPAGHILIAGLFADRLAAFPPRAPSAIEKSVTGKPAHWRIQWQACLESDFACYRMEYGPSEGAMTNVAVLDGNFIVLPGFVSRKTFFRLQTVDAAGNRSDFSEIHTTSERDRLAQNPSPHKAEILRHD
jgi:lysophospholipase L1-like esterase